MRSAGKPRLQGLFVVLTALLLRSCSGCGGIFNHDKGLLRSPASGENIGQITRCDYILQVPYGQRIKVVFIDLVLKTPCCSCVHDYVELRDGSSANSTLIGRYCAQNLPKIIYSTGRELWIRFESDFRTSLDNRFRLTYNAICGRHYTSLTDRFTSPGFPNPQEQDSSECIYTIAVPRGRIKIEFDTFELDQQLLERPAKTINDCKFDFIEVKEIRYVEFGSPNSQPTTPYRRYCRDNPPPIIYSTKGSYVWLRFQRDSSRRKSAGFSAKYRTVSVGEGSCNGQHSAETGLIYSQNYPFAYPKNKECSWSIEVGKGKHVHLEFDTFHFSRSSQDCRYGYVRVYDGPDYVSKIGQFCGTIMPSKVVSRSNKLTIRALSGDKDNTGWFSARYMALSEGPCGPKKFTCKSRQCIDDFLQCNGHNNCKDGSDEVDCPPEKELLSWYSFWPVTVVIVMLFMGIWLWRTWRKFISPRSNIERNYCPSPCHHHSNGGISEVLEPPSYHEAILQQPQPPPSYEEAVATQNPATANNPEVSARNENMESSTIDTNTRNIQDSDTHAITISPSSGNHSDLVVGYHRQSTDSLRHSPYTTHRQQDFRHPNASSSML